MAKLYFYFSAMNAGKTTTLLQSAHNYRERGMRVAILTPRLDHRDGSGVVASRIGLQADANLYRPETDLWDSVAPLHAVDPIACVLIDEAQFLSPQQVQQLHRLAHTRHVPVICFGLRSDFRGEPFPGAAWLLALAEDIEEIKTICHCGRKATMHIRRDGDGRRIKEGPQVEIGDEARYHAVCAKCFYA